MVNEDYLVEGTAVQLRRCRHGLLAFLAFDEYVGRSLERYGEFSELEVTLLTDYLAAGAVVVDAGANVGTHTVAFARQVGEGGRVLAFEPQRPIFELLCANVAINCLWQAHPMHAALAAHRGSIIVPELNLEQRFNFAGVELGGWDHGEAVLLARLDEFELDRCDLIKIDVEGMECQVLEGAQRTIARHHPILYVENDREQHSSDLIEHLLVLDYDLFWHLPPLFNPDNFRGEEENIFQGLVSLNVLGLPRLGEARAPEGLRRIASPSDRASSS